MSCFCNNLKDTGWLLSAKTSGKLLQAGVFKDERVRFQIYHLSNLAVSSENVLLTCKQKPSRSREVFEVITADIQPVRRNIKKKANVGPLL